MSESNNARRVPQFLAELADVTARVIASRLQATSEQAAQVGMEVARTVSREFAGELLYVAKGTGLDTDDRDLAMLKFFLANDRNAQATAKEFGVCVQQTYRRIRQLEADREMLKFHLDNGQDIQVTAQKFGLKVDQAMRRLHCISRFVPDDHQPRQAPLFSDA